MHGPIKAYTSENDMRKMPARDQARIRSGQSARRIPSVSARTQVPYRGGQSYVGGGAPGANSVNAGGPYSGTVLTAIDIHGVVQMSSPATYLWQVDSGGAGTFGTATDLVTTFTPDTEVDSVLSLTATPAVGDPVVDLAALASVAA